MRTSLSNSDFWGTLIVKNNAGSQKVCFSDKPAIYSGSKY